MLSFSCTELITASPLLYSTLKLLEEWESIFTKRLDSLGPVPEDFFTQGDEDEDSLSFQVGPALHRHKSILEPDHSPFRCVRVCGCVIYTGAVVWSMCATVGLGKDIYPL